MTTTTKIVNAVGIYETRIWPQLKRPRKGSEPYDGIPSWRVWAAAVTTIDAETGQFSLPSTVDIPQAPWGCEPDETWDADRREQEWAKERDYAIAWAKDQWGTDRVHYLDERPRQFELPLTRDQVDQLSTEALESLFPHDRLTVQSGRGVYGQNASQYVDTPFVADMELWMYIQNDRLDRRIPEIHDYRSVCHLTVDQMQAMLARWEEIWHWMDSPRQRDLLEGELSRRERRAR